MRHIDSTTLDTRISSERSSSGGECTVSYCNQLYRESSLDPLVERCTPQSSRQSSSLVRPLFPPAHPGVTLIDPDCDSTVVLRIGITPR